MVEIVVVDNPKPSVWKDFVDLVATRHTWAISYDELNCWNKAFGNDIKFRVYLTKDTNQLVASIAMGTYKSSRPDGPPVSAIGSFFTVPEYREHRFGSQMFNSVVNAPENEDHNKCLIGVAEMAGKYASRHGFKLEWDFRWDSYITPGTDFNPSVLEDHPDVVIRSAEEVEFEKIDQFDKTIASDIIRTNYLKYGLEMACSTSVIALDKAGNVNGVLRGKVCPNDQLNLGPFYADSFEVAEALLKGFFNKLPIPLTDFRKIIIVAPSTNLDFKKLWAKVTDNKAKVGKSMHAQFTRELLKVPTDRVYGVFDYIVSYV